MTFDPDFKVTAFSTLNIPETTRDRAIVTIELQQEVVCALSHSDISNDIDGPQPGFQGRGIFEVLGTKFLQNANRKSYAIYRMVPLSMTFSDVWRGFQGHDIFEAEYQKNGAS